MSRVVTRAEYHRRMDSVMEPHLGYCRECRQTWPCQYEQGRADEREAERKRIKDGVKELTVDPGQGRYAQTVVDIIDGEDA